MKYQLLLKDILRYTERAQLHKERQDLLKAVEVMLVVPKAADDMMNVGRLNGFPGKLTAQGKLIKQGILLFCDITPLLAQLDSAAAGEILTQFEARRQQQQLAQRNGSPFLPAPGSSEAGSWSSQQQQPLTTQLIGTSQMTDRARILLNHMLCNSNQVKLSERQTFLFEQTIIFSEISSKSSSSSSSSASHHHHHQHHHHHSNHHSNPITAFHLSASNQSQSSTGAAAAAAAAAATSAAAAAATTPTSYHPPYPHSHNAHGAVENCCTQPDCPLPQTATPACSRLGITHAAAPAPAASPSSPGAATSEAHRNSLAGANHHSADSTSTSSLSGGGGGGGHRDSSAFLFGKHANASGAANHHHHFFASGSRSGQQQQQQIPQYHSMPTYEYKNHLSINKIALIDKHYGPSQDLEQLCALLGGQLDLDLESRRFMLKSRDPNQEQVIYLLQTGCAFDRDDWVANIRSMLECQLDFLRALQSPIAYQRGLTQDG